MTIDALDDGECCAYCGTPIFFYGEGMTDCPGCGAEWVNAEDDPADRLDGPAVDEMEFDNDPDMIENDEFDDLGDELEGEQRLVSTQRRDICCPTAVKSQF